MSDAEYYKDQLMRPIDFGAVVNAAVAAQEYNIWSWQDLLDKGDADAIKLRILQWAPSMSHPEMLESGLPLLDGVITATDKLDDDSALHLVEIIMDNVKPIRWAGYDAETVRRACMHGNR
ncbi:HEAT repeat domain-containing protein [Plasmodiophora brassicae]